MVKFAPAESSSSKKQPATPPRTGRPSGRGGKPPGDPSGSGPASNGAAANGHAGNGAANGHAPGGRAGSPPSPSLSGVIRFGDLRQAVPHSQGFVTTTLPRGGLQVVQPRAVPESILRPYTRGGHAVDALSWQAIRTGKPARAEDVERDDLLEQYQSAVMAPAGMAYAAAAPLASPVLDGYPGALHVYRLAEHGKFTGADLKRLADYARDAGQELADQRSAKAAAQDRLAVLAHDAPVRLFAVNQKLEPVFPDAGLGDFDERLRANLIDHARVQFHHLDRDALADRTPGQPVASARVTAACETGELWAFRATMYAAYPAIADGPVLFFGLQPPCEDWAMLRAEDFNADEELSRLIPAINFMADRFKQGPTLHDIAAVVKLSPFHFHRRFTELLGITPKHFMFDCQIGEAKKHLVAGEVDLIEVARDCGFAHQSHFTSRFKQATGLTPTRWRRLAETEASA